MDMATDADINIEHRLTEVEQRAKSNTNRLNEHDEILKRAIQLHSKYIYQTDRESLYRALLFKCLDRRYYYDRERNQIKGC